MTAAHIYWNPSLSSPLQDLDLGRPLSSIEDYELRDESISVSFSGRRTRTVFTVTRGVDVVSDLLDGSNYDVIRQCETLCNHLCRGGLISVGESNRTLGGYLRIAPTTTALAWKSNLYKHYGNYTPLQGDILVLSGPGPTMLWEEVEVATGGSSGDTHATLTDDVLYDWTDESYVFVRNKTFWPALRLQSGVDPRGLITHGNRITFRLELPLEVPPDAYDSLSRSSDPIVVTGSVDDNLPSRVLQTGAWSPLHRRGWWGS